MTNPSEVPDLVRRALRSSLAFGYVHATRNETGRLLAALAASRPGRIADLGTGCGAAAAWLRLGAPEQAEVVSVERDPALAELARQTLAGTGVDVITGGCAELAARGPYDLLYLDRETAAAIDRERLCAMVTPGGIVVVDDFGGLSEPLTGSAQGELTRHEWLQDERFEAAEVGVAPDASVLLATRKY